ncbi:MAG: hypothetical protein ACTSVM_01170, partial [Candidatus Ranarchaeia archaeon]
FILSQERKCAITWSLSDSSLMILYLLGYAKPCLMVVRQYVGEKEGLPDSLLFLRILFNFICTQLRRFRMDNIAF